jgi:hypothetical protein
MTSVLAHPEQLRTCKVCGDRFDGERDVHICYEPAEDAPTLFAFMESSAFVRLLVGPVGSGKTSASIMELVSRAMEVPKSHDGIRHSRAVIIRNTYRELEDTTRKTFESWISPALGKWSEQDFTFTLKFADVECEVLFRALDRPDHVRKLLSLELTFAYINEAREVPKAVFDMLGTRLGRFPAKKDVETEENPSGEYWHGLWMDSNPCDTDHWMYRLFEEDKPRRTVKLDDGREIEVAFTREVIPLEDGRELDVTLELYKQPGGLDSNAENVRNLQPGYYQRQMLGKDDDWIAVNVHGRWGFVKTGKPVYPEYNDTLHCKKVLPNPSLPILVGMDFGLTPAAVLAQRVPGSGQLQVFDELVSEHLGAVNFAKELARKLKAEYPGRPVRGWGDPAGTGESQVDERTCYDALAAGGLETITEAPTNDPVRRQEAVRGLLGRLGFTGHPAIIIDPKCKVLRKGFMGGYCRARVKVAGDERYHDKPVKNAFSHVHDGLQYLCVGEGEDDRALHGTRQRKVKVRFTTKRAARW